MLSKHAKLHSILNLKNEDMINKIINELKITVNPVSLLVVLLFILSMPLIMSNPLGVGLFSKFAVDRYIPAVIFMSTIVLTCLFFMASFNVLLSEYKSRWLVVVLSAFVASIIASLLRAYLVGNAFSYFESFANFMYALREFPYALSICFGLSEIRQHHFRQKDELARAIKEEKVKNQNTEMQLRLLQAQIEPHFLFNSLAHIHALLETQPSNAKDVLLNLITYLRAATPSVKQQTNSIKDDLKLVQGYLNIQKSRFADRFDFSITVDDDLQEIEIPSFILLTLVENAIIHAIEPCVDGGKIYIHAFKKAEKLMITTINSGLKSKSFYRKEGVGLRNIKERLNIMYGSDAAFSIVSDDNDFTVATLTLTLPSQNGGN